MNVPTSVTSQLPITFVTTMTTMARPTKSHGADPSADSPAAGGRQAIHGSNAADYGDRVAQKAYELYLARGAGDGQDFDDWLTAERELTHGHDRQGGPGE